MDITELFLFSRGLCRRGLAAVLFCTLTATLLAQSDRPGVIVGTISNAATGAYLEGARVEVEGTGRAVFTDRDGIFQVAPLAPGSYALKVSYTGLDETRVAVAVAPGETSRQQIGLTAEVYQMSAYVVAGEREGSAQAITLQRQAQNVKEVLSSDAFGSLSNQNIGDFLQRVTGISTDWVEGEPKRIQIRGLAPEYNAVTIDGVEMPTGTVKSGRERGVEIDTVPADFIAMIEVTKSPTPDMPAHSVGGSVNLVSKSPFERRSGGNYSAGFNYDISNGGRARPYFTAQYNRILGAKENVGLLLTSSYSDFAAMTSVVELSHLASAVDPAWATLTRFRADISEKERFSLGGKLSYRFSDRTWITGSLLYSHYKDAYRAFANQFSGGTVVPGFTNRVNEFNNSTFASAITQRFTDVDNFKLSLTGRHTTRSGRLDVDATWMPSEGTERRFSPTRQVTGIRTLTDRTRSLHYPAWSQTGGRDITDLNHSTMTLSRQNSKATDEVVSARADYRHTLTLPAPAWLQGGVRYSSREKSQDFGIENHTYSGPGPMSKFLDPGRRMQIDGRYPYIPFADPVAIERDFIANPGHYPLTLASSTSSSFLNDYDIKEAITAAYVMGGVQTGPLSTLAGIRAERTKVEGEGSFDLGARVTSPLERYGSKRRGEASYDDVFPGIHFRLDARKDVVVRASYTMSIARPNFRSIIPNLSINDTTLVLTANNPALKPQYSDNFDIVVEYYFEPVGLVSAGVFQKELDNFVFTTATTVGTGPNNGFDGQYAGYELRTPGNGGGARVRGVEAGYRQQFTFLPGWLQGFGAFANFTWLETEGTYSAGVARLAGFVPKTGNAGISYSKYGLTARLNGNYRGTYLNNYNANPMSQRYTKSRKMLDLKVEYVIWRHLSVMASISNITNAPDPWFIGIGERSARYLKDARKMSFGVGGRF
jgi:iron complex outermembrane recepter protein